MIVRDFLNYNRNSIKKLKKHPNHAFKLGRPPRHRPTHHLILPSAFAGYEYSIERGLKPRDFLARPKMLILIALMMLPLAWWFDNSSAFYAPEPESDKVDLSQPAFAKIKKLALPTLSDMANSKTSTSLWLPILVTSGDNLSTIFEKHGFNKNDLRQILQLKSFSQKLMKLYPSQTLHIKYDTQKNVEELLLELDFAEKLHIYRTKEGFDGKINDSPVSPQIIPALVDVTTSLFEDGQKAGLSKEMISRLVGICRWDIDFQSIDHFSVIYQQYYFEGTSKEGDILALKLVGQDESSCEAVRYKSVYYKPNGEPLHNIIGKLADTTTGTFLTPVQFTKISSDYGMREHPILGKMLFHKGIDYAAPTGTPIIAVANAIVAFVGYKKGYGKTIILQHDEHHDTLYAHLLDYAENLVEGKVVSQADVIGYVGQTGATTGPHLHYEHHVDDEPQNPLEIENNKTMIVEENQKKDADFFKQTRPLLAQLIQLEEDHRRHPTLASQQIASTKTIPKSVAK
ncbi:MAG: hypothetical protein BWK79_00860 [Beggiatoa sp. IS2]|nr:MAG: hypothetical protein BWK79_00860 [Beggiatoa sp. IS2]